MNSAPSRTRRAITALGLDDPRLRGLLILLWATTAAYVALHLTRRFFGVPWSPNFDLGTERGYGEVFFQMLIGWSIVLLVVVAVRTRAWIMLLWAVFALYLLADDYFTVHERIGTWFAQTVLYVGPLSTHIGEALWLLTIGVLLIVSVAIAFRFSTTEARRTTLTVGALFGALALFGVGVDILHSPFIDLPIVDPLFIALEDGGEIAVMSLLVTYLVSLAFPRDALTIGGTPTAAPAKPTR